MMFTSAALGAARIHVFALTKSTPHAYEVSTAEAAPRLLRRLTGIPWQSSLCALCRCCHKSAQLRRVVVTKSAAVTILSVASVALIQIQFTCIWATGIMQW